MAKRALLFLTLLWLAGTTAGLSQSSTGPGATGVAAMPDGNAATLAITSIMVDKSELLEESAVRGIVSEYEGRTVSLQDLQRAVDAINQLYAEKGYITAKAILPPQEIRMAPSGFAWSKGALGMSY
jgi:hemolysin activation/secretion protein